MFGFGTSDYLSPMSTQRGNTSKSGQKHQNSHAFKHNKNSKKTEKILSAPNVGLCKACTEKIEWRKRYRKYKPLTAPRKCSQCQEKRVKQAYHILCEPCATAAGVCAKCLKAGPVANQFLSKEQEEKAFLEAAIDQMREREKRAFLRQLENEGSPRVDRKKDSIDSDESFSSDDDDDTDPVSRTLREATRRARKMMQSPPPAELPNLSQKRAKLEQFSDVEDESSDMDENDASDSSE